MKQPKPRNSERCVFYRAPCGRLLRNEDELDHYLHITDSRLTIDLFSFDPSLTTDEEFVSKKVQKLAAHYVNDQPDARFLLVFCRVSVI